MYFVNEIIGFLKDDIYCESEVDNIVGVTRSGLLFNIVREALIIL